VKGIEEMDVVFLFFNFSKKMEFGQKKKTKKKNHQ
jgi:hypothetical protein